MNKLSNLNEVSKNAAIEGIVLLENDMLPLIGDVSVFGRCQIDYYRSGTGSGGAVNVPFTVNALDGMRMNDAIQLNEELANVYVEWVKKNPFDNGGGGWAQEPWFQEEMPLTDELVRSARKKSENAVVIIGRTAGEDKDNGLYEGGYLLTEAEKDVLRRVTNHFDNVAVILNTSNTIDMSFVDEFGIKTVLYSWQAGMVGGIALAEVLSGESPSGKLTSTIAKEITDYPSHLNFGDKVKNVYEEDIYVGYRYFNTMKNDSVMYPFGYGLSYTDFEITVKQTFVESDKIKVDVSVKNIGAIAGKEVVQVYMNCPIGLLGNPYIKLVAFSKTSLLNPGEEEIVEVEFDYYSFSSYDDTGVTNHKSSYVLEEGNYKVLIGNSSVDLIVAREMFIPFKVVESLTECMGPKEDFKRMKFDGEFTYSDLEKTDIDMAKRITLNMPVEIPQTENKGIKLKDVVNNTHSIEEFVAQFTVEDLVAIVRGEGMGSPKVTPGTASAFGGVTNSLLELGIGVACTSDGPSGIRMDTGQVATQVPIGTMLACTWNVSLVEELYSLQGKELIENKVDSLLGPGLNIQRHPLNGRNFEYFSEDPVVSGEFAAAMIRGIQSTGATATMKHFVANNQETERHNVDSVVSERALREIYLKGFEIAVKKGNAKSVMTSYNPINGVWAASNYDLNTNILRNEWGFEGIVMTDWWAKMNHPVHAGEASTKHTGHMVRAQNDLYMVIENDGASYNANNDDSLKSLANGDLTIAELQRSAINICKFIMDLPVMYREIIIKKTIEFESTTVIDVGIKEDGSINVSLDEGVYELSGKVKCHLGELAQAAVSVKVNNNVIGTLQSNGTEGKWKTVICGSFKAEALNLVEFEFIKSGIELNSITLNKHTEEVD